MFYGCALLNAVSVDINFRLAAPEVAFIVNDAQAKVFVVGPDFVPVLDAIVGDLKFTKKIVVIGGHPTHESYESWVSRHQPVDPGTDSKPHDVAFQLYSAYSTPSLPSNTALVDVVWRLASRYVPLFRNVITSLLVIG